eukprot:366532-Chlamydomonas_euryale.AAC.5
MLFIHLLRYHALLGAPYHLLQEPRPNIKMCGNESLRLLSILHVQSTVHEGQGTDMRKLRGLHKYSGHSCYVEKIHGTEDPCSASAGTGAPTCPVPTHWHEMYGGSVLVDLFERAQQGAEHC